MKARLEPLHLARGCRRLLGILWLLGPVLAWASPATRADVASPLRVEAVSAWRHLAAAARRVPRVEVAATPTELPQTQALGLLIRGAPQGRLVVLTLDSAGVVAARQTRAAPSGPGNQGRSLTVAGSGADDLPFDPGRYLVAALLLRDAGGEVPAARRNWQSALPDLLTPWLETAHAAVPPNAELLALGLDTFIVCLARRPCPGSARTRPALDEIEDLLRPPPNLPPGIFRDEAPPPGDPVRALPEAALAIIKAAEGWRAQIYEDPAGFCTIGHGHLVKRGPCDAEARARFAGALTPQEGERLLREDLRAAQLAVERLVRVRLEDSQYAALVSFVFNVGVGNFSRSRLLALLNRHESRAVVTQLGLWTAVRGVELEGLRKRREEEARLFAQAQGLTATGATRRIEITGSAIRRMQSEQLPLIDIEEGE